MIRILFLAANPTDQLRLQLRRELDELRRALDAAPHGRRFALIQEFAVAADQLQELLVRHQPQIVHFSGHGSEAGLLFEAADGRSQRVAPATLRDLFTGFRQTVRCVVLNACYSQQHANAIATVIDSVVGMSDALTDEAALAFATAFYRALANGSALADALHLGRNQLDLQGLDEAHKPQLLADRIDASQVRALGWDDGVPTTATTASPTTTINSIGGTVVGRDVQVGEGDFVNRNKIVIQQQTNIYQNTSPVTQPPATRRDIFGLYPFNKHFFGRDEELTTLHTLLQTERSVSICPVISGMGGLGKTQLAAHYARAHVADYPDGIFWINAANLNEIGPQLADFCVVLGLPIADPQRIGDLIQQKISAFKNYLDQHPSALLIFDNVEEPNQLWTYQIGAQLTALKLGGKAIVTTRRRKLASDKFAELALQRLLPVPAQQILTTARTDLNTDPDLEHLCKQFGYLPLMLNLAAAALKKRGGTIAGYLQRLHTFGPEQLHWAVAKVNLDDYHKSLNAVLQEQWDMLQDNNARLLLRVAGQLPEATVISSARLGLLAGLADVDEWECPLSDALDELERTSLLEHIDQEKLRIHPLVRDFAATMVASADRAAFCMVCAQHMDTAYNELNRLGQEYTKRGIDALLVDLIVAINLAKPGAELPQSPIARLQLLLRRLRLESSHLQGNALSWRPERLWQQLLPRTMSVPAYRDNLSLSNLLRHTWHWLPYWSQHRQSLADEPFIGHESSVKVVMINDQRIVSISDDGMLKLWHLATGQPERILVPHKVWITAIAVVERDYVVSAAFDGTLKVWHLATGQLIQTLIGHERAVTALEVIDQQHIVSTSNDGTLKVWNLASGQSTHTLSGHKRAVYTAAKVDGQRIVSVSDDCTLKVWNLASSQSEHTLDVDETWVTVVCVVDGQRIVSASLDGTIKVWSLATGKLDLTLAGHESAVTAVTVVDCEHIVSAAFDGTLKVWHLATGQLKQKLIGHKHAVTALEVIDQQHIISASSDRTLKAWNLHSSQAIASIELDEPLQCMAVTRQGKRALVVVGDTVGALYCLELVEPVASAGE